MRLSHGPPPRPRALLPGLAVLLSCLTGCDGCLPEIPEVPSDTGQLDFLDVASRDTNAADSTLPGDTAGDTLAAADGSGPDAQADVAIDTGTPDVDLYPGLDLAQIQAEVLAPRCGACHIDRANPLVWLALNDELAARLRAPSVQLPAMPLITPGNPEASYLWRKVSDSHTAVGGLGGVMPLGEAPLDERQRTLLRVWIERGAP